MDINQVNDQMMHYNANSQMQVSFTKTKFRPRK